MRAIWDIGVKYRGWQAPYTDHCAHHPPTKYITQSPPKIHLMKYQMVSISNYWNEEKGSDVFKANRVQNGLSLSRKDELVDQWKNEFGDYYPPVTSDSSLHLSGLGGQTDGLSLISPESVVSTHKKDPKKGVGKNLLNLFHTYSLFQEMKFVFEKNHECQILWKSNPALSNEVGSKERLKEMLILV